MATDEKPSRNEEEYFLKLDAELIARQRAKRDAERADMERRASAMKCPRDGADLAEKDLERIKVDVCPKCNGVWFDGGELDLLRKGASGGLGRFFGMLGSR
ncbi:MAG: zf-TFIIB domain-containing protein [Gemmatimonadaceae bacterium]